MPKIICQKIGMMISMLFICVALFAQDTKKIDIDINGPEDKQWYAQPWAWVVFGAIFILLLVALLRRKD